MFIYTMSFGLIRRLPAFWRMVCMLTPSVEERPFRWMICRTLCCCWVSVSSSHTFSWRSASSEDSEGSDALGFFELNPCATVLGTVARSGWRFTTTSPLFSFSLECRTVDTIVFRQWLITELKEVTTSMCWMVMHSSLPYCFTIPTTFTVRFVLQLIGTTDCTRMSTYQQSWLATDARQSFPFHHE